MLEYIYNLTPFLAMEKMAVVTSIRGKLTQMGGRRHGSLEAAYYYIPVHKLISIDAILSDLGRKSQR